MEIFGKEMTSPEFWPASLLLQLGRSFYGPEEAAMHHPPFCDGDGDEDDDDGDDDGDDDIGLIVPLSPLDLDVIYEK